MIPAIGVMTLLSMWPIWERSNNVNAIVPRPGLKTQRAESKASNRPLKAGLNDKTQLSQLPRLAS